METKKEKLALSIISLCLGFFGMILLVIPHIFFTMLSFLFILVAISLAILALVFNHDTKKNLALIAISAAAVSLFTFGLMQSNAAYFRGSRYDSYQKGYDDGYDDGYDERWDELFDDYSIDYDDYDEGYDDGYDDGFDDGYETGYEEGLEKGKTKESDSKDKDDDKQNA